MLNRTVGCLHRAGTPAIRVTEVVSPATSAFDTATCAEPAPVRGHCVDRIYGRVQIRALVKMCSDRPRSCEVPICSYRLERLRGIATSYSEARDRVFMSVSACRSDRYELIVISYS